MKCLTLTMSRDYFCSNKEKFAHIPRWFLSICETLRNEIQVSSNLLQLTGLYKVITRLVETWSDGSFTQTSLPLWLLLDFTADNASK